MNQFSPEQLPRHLTGSVPNAKYISATGALIQILSSRIFLVFFLASTIAAITFLAKSHQDIIKNDAEKLYAYFCITLVSLSTMYIYMIHSRKLHRYSRAVIHYHFVNHTVRNALALLRQQIDANQLTQDGAKAILSEQLNLVLTSISTCFSLISGQNCAVCLKELKVTKEGLALQTVARDFISSASRGKRDDAKNLAGQPLEYNTPCRAILYSEVNEGRYFMHNDLPSLWVRGKYYNIGLKDKVPGYKLSLLGFRAFVRWKLPYRSVLVTPIRYLPAKLSSNDNDPASDYWGFLCIDSSSRHCFDYKLAPELSMAFADAIYTLISHTAFIANLNMVAPPQIKL